MDIFSENKQYFSGSVIYNKGGRLGSRVQDDLQLVYIHEGEAHITVEGRRQYLGQNEATLLLPGRREFFQFSMKTRTRHGWCGIARPQLEDGDLRQLGSIDLRYPFTDRMKTLEGLFLTLRESSDTGLVQLHQTLVQAMLIEFLNQTEILNQKRPPRHPAIDKACAFIGKQFPDPLDLNIIALQAGVTPAHLIRLFKEEFGQTPTAYIWQIRTKAAARLLRNTGLSAAEVAYQCGFANPNHFSRRFQQEKGLPPRTWRMREWNKE